MSEIGYLPGPFGSFDVIVDGDFVGAVVPVRGGWRAMHPEGDWVDDEFADRDDAAEALRETA